MPQVFTICQKPERNAIDQALHGNQSITRIAAGFQVTRAALRRHRDNHLRPVVAAAAQAAHRLTASQLLDRLNEVYTQTAAVLRETRADLDTPNSLRALLRLEHQIQLALNLAIRAQAEPPEPITATDFNDFKETMLTALIPFPEAHLAVSNAFRKLPAGHQPFVNQSEPAQMTAKMSRPTGAPPLPGSPAQPGSPT